jgi:hypothetical protein
MPVPKSEIGRADVYVQYDYESVMFRWDGAAQKFFRRFVGETEETEVPHDNRLLNDALRFGDAIDRSAYRETK